MEETLTIFVKEEPEDEEEESSSFQAQLFCQEEDALLR
jgi:hypothetical protein